MIDEKEIRIGNWFHHNIGWSYRSDKNIEDCFDFQWDARDWYGLGECTMDLELVIPIVITEEWLTKFGFVKYKPKVYTFNEPYDFYTKDFDGGALRITLENGTALLFTGDEYMMNVAMDYDTIYIPSNYRYVHELQNLYYALTKEELTIE